MKLMKTLLATTVLVSVAGLAMAADNGGLMGDGAVYTDLNLGVSTDFRSKPAGSAASFDRYRFGGNVNVGKMHDQNWGLEAGYSYMPGFESTTAGVTSEAVNHVVDVAAKGVYKLGDDVSLYGKLGPAFVRTETKTTGKSGESANTLALYYAAGVAYDFGSGLGANVQVSGVSNSKDPKDLSPHKKDPALMLVSAGLSYSFGA